MASISKYQSMNKAEQELTKAMEKILKIDPEHGGALIYQVAGEVVFGKVEVLGGDDVDTKSSSVKSSSGKVKTTKQRATESESEPDLPSNSVKRLFDNITLIGPGEQPTPSKPSKGITHKKDKQDVRDEMVLNNLLDNEEVIHVPTTPIKQGAANLKRVKLGANNSVKSSNSKVKTTKQQATKTESEPDLPSNSVKRLFNNITLIGPSKQPTPSKPSKGITYKKDKQDVADKMVLNNLLDNKEVVHVPTSPTKQGAANPKRVKLGANNSTPVAIPRVGTRASGRQRV